MATIIDRRTTKDKSTPNRKKLIDRYKEALKESVKKAVDQRSLKDLAKGGGSVSIGNKSLKEPMIRKDYNTGEHKKVLPGNPGYNRGDSLRKPPQGMGAQGTQGDDSEDEFSFLLTKEEFIELLFEDMRLPNWVKKQLLSDTEFKMRRAGVQNEGTPNRLDLQRTMRQSIARRLTSSTAIKDRIKELEAGEAEEWEGELEDLKKKKVRYLDDVDLRFKQYVKDPQPDTKAVMFLIMDVSGSMDERKKHLLKTFFLLLYMFLVKSYGDKVELVFITHTETAELTDEHNFFYSRRSGGTRVSSAYELCLEQIKEKYSPAHYNIYIAQGSDGDNWGEADDEYCEDLLTKLCDLSQFLLYLRVKDIQRNVDSNFDKTVRLVGYNVNNLAFIDLDNPDSCYAILRELFHKDNFDE